MLRPLFLFALLAASPSAFAQSASFTVTATRAEIHAEPTFDSPTLATLSRGMNGSVLQEQTEWVRVLVAGEQGFVHRALVEVTRAVAAPVTSPPRAAAPPVAVNAAPAPRERIQPMAAAPAAPTEAVAPNRSFYVSGVGYTSFTDAAGNATVGALSGFASSRAGNLGLTAWVAFTASDPSISVLSFMADLPIALGDRFVIGLGSGVGTTNFETLDSTSQIYLAYVAGITPIVSYQYHLVNFEAGRGALTFGAGFSL